MRDKVRRPRATDGQEKPELSFRRAALIVSIVVLAIAAGGYLVLRNADLASLAARYASVRTGRKVTIGSLKIHLDRAKLVVDLHGLSVANRPGGSQPSMVDLGELQAEIDPWTLIEGPVRIDRLSLDGMSVLLEHGTDDVANWKIGGRHALPGSGKGAPPPILLDGRFKNLEIAIRTTGGAMLRIRIDDATAGAALPDKPVSIVAQGSYNAVPVQLTASLPSFAAMARMAKPFPTSIVLKSKAMALAFEGTIVDPMNFDGLDGRAILGTPKTRDLLAIAGIADDIDSSLTLSGHFTHSGDAWQVADGIGTLNGGNLKTSFKILEGARHQSDAVTFDAALAKLNLDAFVHPSSKTQPMAGVSLMVDPNPGALVDLHVAADHFVYGTIRADAVDLKAKLGPGALTVEQLALSIAGGAAKSRVAIANHGDKAQVDFDGSLTGVDLAQLSNILGWGKLPIEGPIDSHVSGSMTGATLTETQGADRIFALVTMAGGAVDRHLVSLAATDIRALFGGGKGEGVLNCLLAVLDLKDGKGIIGPVRIKTSDGTILGSGSYDAKHDYLDMAIATQRSTTSFFALDVPVRLSGPVGDISAAPAFRTERPNGTGDIANLPADMQALVKSSPCFTP